MIDWLNHVASTPMRQLAWYDQVACYAAIVGLLGGTIAVFAGIEKLRRRLTRDR